MGLILVRKILHSHNLTSLPWLGSPHTVQVSSGPGLGGHPSFLADCTAPAQGLAHYPYAFSFLNMYELLKDTHGPILLQTYDVTFNSFMFLTDARFVYIEHVLIEHVQQVLLEEYFFLKIVKLK